jgi:hypothetical protein
MNTGRKNQDKEVSKTDALHGLHLLSTYFERHMQNQELFRPEYEVSKTINSILKEKDALAKTDVVEILNLLNDIDKVEHYDGSGWHDYQIQLAHFLSLNGFNTEFKDKILSLTGHL